MPWRAFNTITNLSYLQKICNCAFSNLQAKIPPFLLLQQIDQLYWISPFLYLFLCKFLHPTGWSDSLTTEFGQRFRGYRGKVPPSLYFAAVQQGGRGGLRPHSPFYLALITKGIFFFWKIPLQTLWIIFVFFFYNPTF